MIGDSFPVCQGALSAAVAHLKRSQTHMKIFSMGVLLVVILLTTSVYSQEFVRIANRESSRRHFTGAFQNTEPAISWTGNSTTGDAGTISGAFRTAVFAQINYFRSQAGVQPVVENLTYSSKAQQAAFLMSVNKRLDHYPTSEWTFYTADAAEAALRSDLYLGQNGIKAIEGYIDDPGSNNARVGHRNWILRPETETMGTGDVPVNGGYSKANALWVVTSEYASRPEFALDFAH